MGLFKRLHRITVGRIETFLDRVEDPEIMFPVLIEEMSAQLIAATDAEAKASAALKRSQRDLKKQEEKVVRYGNGAALALKKSDEETARMSVEAQIDAETTLEIAQRNVDSATDALDHAVVSRKRIQQQLDELNSKKGEILTRARVAKAQKKIQRTVSGSTGSTSSILDAVARLEAGVEETEAELEIQASLTGESTASPSLERRIIELSHDGEIEKRLAKIRKEVVEANG